jgi:hypothetical protein
MCVCVPLILLSLNAVIFNPIYSTILKLLKFKIVGWRHDFQPCTAMVWDCLIDGLLWLHHTRSIANVTMVTIVIGKVGKFLFSCCFVLTYNRKHSMNQLTVTN